MLRQHARNEAICATAGLVARRHHGALRFGAALGAHVLSRGLRPGRRADHHRCYPDAKFENCIHGVTSGNTAGGGPKGRNPQVSIMLAIDRWPPDGHVTRET